MKYLTWNQVIARMDSMIDSCNNYRIDGTSDIKQYEKNGIIYCHYSYYNRKLILYTKELTYTQTVVRSKSKLQGMIEEMISFIYGDKLYIAMVNDKNVIAYKYFGTQEGAPKRKISLNTFIKEFEYKMIGIEAQSKLLKQIEENN